MCASGPIHLIGTAVFTAGIFVRIFAVVHGTHLVMYLVPLGVAFLSTWLFNSFTIASVFSWGPGWEAWKEVLAQKKNLDTEERNINNKDNDNDKYNAKHYESSSNNNNDNYHLQTFQKELL